MKKLGSIYAITDPQLLPGDRLFWAVEAVLKAGIRTVQLRDKLANDDQLYETARRLVSLCNEFEANCIINDRLDIALETQAHGIHLGQSDGSIRQARSQLGEAAIIGATCHSSLELAKTAIAKGASYVAFGRFYSSSTKPQANAASMNILSTAAQALSRPIVAIGGINRDNMSPLVAAGANTLAVCHSVFGTDDPASAAKNLLNTYEEAIHSSLNFNNSKM